MVDVVWQGFRSSGKTEKPPWHDWPRAEDAAYRALWWNLRGTYCYLQSNAQYLVNYGWRYRRGMPISSSIAESAVNEVVSLRWTNKGAHLLVQVREAVLNGELKMRDMPDRRRTSTEKKNDDHCQCVA